jgi:hypothetical protein
LKNAAGDQIHSVSYSQADVRHGDRYVRFNT